MYNVSVTAHKKLSNVIALLKYSYGLAALVVGADKFFNFFATWHVYLHAKLAPLFVYISVQQPMYLIGIIEIVVGIIILSRFTRLGAYILPAWFFVIVVNLVAMGAFYDIALRDFLLGVGALSLGKLISVRQKLLEQKS